MDITADHYCQSGDGYIDMEKYELAEQSYRDALQVDPCHSEAAGGVLCALIEQNLQDDVFEKKTLSFIRRIDRSQYAHSKFLYYCGYVLQQCEQYSEALSAFSLLAVMPEYSDFDQCPDAGYFHGICFLELGDDYPLGRVAAYDEAEKCFKKALDVKQRIGTYDVLIHCFQASDRDCKVNHPVSYTHLTLPTKA